MSTYIQYPAVGSGGGVPVYSTLSAFPSAGGVGAGALGVAQNTGTLYESNGSSWIPIAAYNSPFSLGSPANGLALSSNVLTIGLASNSATGALSSTDWATFNAKQSALSFGTLTETTSSVLTLGSWTNATIGSPTITVKQSSGSQSGYLSSTDWTTFNSKQSGPLTGDVTTSGAAATLATVNSNVGSFTNANITVNAKGLITAASTGSPGGITALTGDVTASGSGSVAATLATVNSNLGSFGSSTAIPAITVNAKGLVTAVTTSAVVAPAGTLSGTTLNSTVVSSSLTSVGTIGTGTWQGSTIATAYGGTGVTTSTGASSNVLRDSNSNVTANNVLEGYATTATAAGTTTLTVSSAYQQFFTGSTTQTVQMPVTSTLVTGQSYWIVNNSTGAVTINSSGSNLISTLAANTSALVTCISTSGTTNASWAYNLLGAGGTNLPGTYYYSGYMTSTGWNTSTTTFADPTINSGTNSLTQRYGTITVSAAASNLPGITFTPSSASAVYEITVSMTLTNSTANLDASLSLTDGTTQIVTAVTQQAGSTLAVQWVTMTGIYAPGTTSAVTVKTQMAAGAGGTSYIGYSNGGSKTMEWKIVRIA
jgi:hypothetical protein